MYVPWWGFIMALFVIAGVAGLNENSRRARLLQFQQQLEELKDRLEDLSSNGQPLHEEIGIIDGMIITLSDEND